MSATTIKPKQVMWSLELPVMGSIRRCTWDIDHGFTVEGMGADESLGLVKLFVTAGIAQQQAAQQQPQAAPPTQPQAPLNQPQAAPLPPQAQSVETQTPMPPMQEVAEPQGDVPEQETPAVEKVATVPAGKRRISWNRRKKFQDKEIVALKLLSDGGASMQFKDGTGCTADAYGNVVGKTASEIASMAVEGEACPVDEDSVPAPAPVQQELAVDEPVPEAPLEEVTPAAEPVTVVDITDAVPPEAIEEAKEEVAAENTGTVDMNSLELTAEMIVEFGGTIRHLVKVKNLNMAQLLEVCNKLSSRSKAFKIANMEKRLKATLIVLDLTVSA